MYIPLNTSTIATALVTAITNSPTSVPSESVLPLGPGVGSGPSVPDTIDNVAVSSNSMKSYHFFHTHISPQRLASTHEPSYFSVATAILVEQDSMPHFVSEDR